MYAQKNLVLNFTKVQGLEVSLVLIKVQILGPQAFLICLKIIRNSLYSSMEWVYVRRDICQKRYI